MAVWPIIGIRPRIHIIADSQALYTQYLQRIAQQKTGLSYGYLFDFRDFFHERAEKIDRSCVNGPPLFGVS